MPSRRTSRQISEATATDHISTKIQMGLPVTTVTIVSTTSKATTRIRNSTTPRRASCRSVDVASTCDWTLMRSPRRSVSGGRVRREGFGHQGGAGRRSHPDGAASEEPAALRQWTAPSGRGVSSSWVMSCNSNR